VKNPCLAAALDELSKAGIRDVVQSNGGNHLQLRWSVNGVTRMFTVPCTPSDWRSPRNTRAQMRRALAEDGMLAEMEKKAPPAKQPDRVTVLEQRIALLEQRIILLEQPKSGS
jgi:hypothetical protein